MKHTLRRTLNCTNLLLCAGLHGGRVRQNMRGAKAAIAQTLEFVSSVVAARVSSMWGFGGNLRGGLHIMILVFAMLPYLKDDLSNDNKLNNETETR